MNKETIYFQKPKEFRSKGALAGVRTNLDLLSFCHQNKAWSKGNNQTFCETQIPSLFRQREKTHGKHRKARINELLTTLL